MTNPHSTSHSSSPLQPSLSTRPSVSTRVSLGGIPIKTFYSHYSLCFPSANFEYIHSYLLHFALDKVLVHCVMGRSRSATLVLAYLMKKQSLTVVDAIEHVRRRRCILPNHGFLKQLRALDISLQEEKLRQRHKLQEQ